MRKLLFLMLPLVAATITACGGGEGDDENHALMAPGQDCMRAGCHAGQFTVAGTVFPSANSASTAGLANVSVVVKDANNVETTLTSNAAGNFYTTKSMALPLQGTYVMRNGKRTDMFGTPQGSCAQSSCHSLGSSLGAVYAE